MATQKITTDLHCRQARPGQELAVADTPGLRLRVYPSGVKSWMYRYRVPVLDSDGNPVMAGEHAKTRLRKIVLGVYPAVSLKQARRLCQEQKNLRSDGGDPIEVKRLTRLENARRAKREREAAEQDAFTVNRLANAYVEKYALARKQSWREDQRIFKKYIVPALGAETPLHTVRRKDVVAMLDTIASTAPVQANRVLAVFRKACNWAVEREYLSAPPTFGVKAPGKEGRRDRYLSESELDIFLRRLPESGLPEDVSRVLQLQVRLGLRLGEVCAAHWREINLDERRWIIPAIRSKNNEPHEVLLTHQAGEILRESDTAGWVFPRNGRTGHLRVDTVTSELRQVLPELGIQAFTSHALRHTVLTHLARLGYGKEVRDRVANHVDRSIDRRYTHHTYEAETRKALEEWNTLLDRLRDGDVGPVVLRLPVV